MSMRRMRGAVDVAAVHLRIKIRVTLEVEVMVRVRTIFERRSGDRYGYG